MDELSKLAERCVIAKEDLLYLAKLADWAAGQGLCQIEGIEDPEEWCFRKYTGDGEDYSPETLAAALQSSRPVGGEAEAAKRLVEIIEDAGRGYNITLTKLVDGEAQYTMIYRGNVTVHPDIDDAHELRQKLAEQEKLEAALAFLRSLPEQDRRHEG